MSRTLYLSANLKESFSYVVHWVGTTLQQSTQNKKLVVLPHQEVAIQLRKTLATQGTPFLNIHFWTPEQLRSRLLRGESETTDFPQKIIASREELHLILSSVASTLPVSTISLLACAVRENPAWLLRVLDMLDSADLQAKMFESLREITPLAEGFSSVLEKQGLQTFNAADRLLASRKLVTQFESLLIFGFHAGHWPIFPLLTAAGRLTNHLEVVLDAPYDASFDLDSSWVGTWEAVLNVAAQPLEEPLSERQLSVFLSDAQQCNSNGSNQPELRSHVEFLAEESIRDLAVAIALKATEFVAEGAKSVAVVFPAYGPLSREVALALNEWEIPHFDAIGHRGSESGETSLWKSWCAFQRARTVSKFTEFLELQPDCSDLVELLREASSETQSQDIPICMEFIRTQKKEERWDVHALLPDSTSLAEFCDLVQNKFSQMSWWNQVACLQLRRERFRQPENLFLTRDIFLRWLEAALRDERRRREPIGSHPYATIQLLRRDQAALCPWTHVILAGLNAGEWPESIEENGLLPADAIADLNRQIACENRSAQTQGPFGEGHLTVTRRPCLGSHERNLLQKRDFQNLCQAPFLLATTILANDARPSVWFYELFQQRFGRLPSKADLLHIVPSKKQRTLLPAKIEEVAAMRRIRLDSTTPFGAWEFTADSPSPPLAVVEIERLFTEPAKVWMKAFLGAEANQQSSSRALVGTWAHRWLRNVCTSQSGIFPDQAFRREIIFSAAEATRVAMEKACEGFRKAIPPWWTFMWQQARSLAFQLSDQLEVFRGRFSFATTEMSFQNVYVSSLGSWICGRWDLVLCSQEIARDKSKPFAETSVFVVDYKTGKDPNIATILRDGRGIQLALYAHAALAWGAQRVDAAWFTPHATDEMVHLPFEELEKIQPILSTLGRMLRTGIFGMRGELRSEFAFRSPMPLATLAIPQDILEAKWKLTHDFESA
jgi:hypothetical protein